MRKRAVANSAAISLSETKCCVSTTVATFAFALLFRGYAKKRSFGTTVLDPETVAPTSAAMSNARFHHSAHGYFGPSDDQSYLGIGDVTFHAGKRYHGEILGLVGAESADAGLPFHAAREIEVRNEMSFRNWNLRLDYSNFHLIQDTGASQELPRNPGPIRSS